MIDGVNQHPEQPILWYPKGSCSSGQNAGDSCVTSLVILHFKTRSLTHLAHSHQLRSHLGAHNTLAKL